MSPARDIRPLSMATAMIASATVGGQFIAGRAARDAVFLTYFDASTLPGMILITALVSIALVLIGSRVFGRVAPEVWVPASFATTALLHLVVWFSSSHAPGPAARILYVLVSGIGPVLGSGFWLIVSEQFDPHTAKRAFGPIEGAGTLGGLLGGLAAARLAMAVDISAMVPLVAALNLGCAWSTRRLARSAAGTGGAAPRSASSARPRSGLRVLSEAPYLRNLAALVLLGTVAATFVDQAFKTEVRNEVGQGPSLGTFFSLYYAALGVVTFVLQAGASRYVLERLGLAAAAGAPALVFLIGGPATLLIPGLRSLMLTRAGEAVFRASIYRTGYELYYTPVPVEDKRRIKSIIDVGVDRSGDILGAILTQQILRIPQPGQTTVLLSLAMVCGGAGMFVARRLTNGYAQALEKSLMERAVELELSEIADRTTRTTMLRALRQSGMSRAGSIAGAGLPTAAQVVADNPEIADIVTLRSGDVHRIRSLLGRDQQLPDTLVSHVIPLLARDEVSYEAIRALRSVAEEHVGAIVDALIDPNQPFAVRRRLARVLSVCVSQRAADGLMLGLDDLRFEVRYQCGRSLLALVQKNPAVRVDQGRVLALIHKEVAVNQEVWNARRLLDTVDEGDATVIPASGEGAQASQSLAHVFTLLGLVLPSEPLRVAFRGLHSDDRRLRGTALEYLDSVLPRDIRDCLWRFLENEGRGP
jgi:hypothetical protein